MAGEIQTIATSGYALYALVFNSTGSIWSTVGSSFGTWADASIADYDIALTEQGTSGIFAGDFPSAITAGTYNIVIKSKLSSSSDPATTDTHAAAGTVYWSGTAIFNFSSDVVVANITKWLSSTPNALVSGRVDASAGALASGVVTASAFGSNAIADAAVAADMDTYQAKVWLFKQGSTSDNYTVIYFKNGQPVTSGITSPTIQVIQVSDGSDLVASTALTEIASTSLFKKVESTNKTTAGSAYIAKVQASIDGSTRTWFQPVGRDS